MIKRIFLNCKKPFRFIYFRSKAKFLNFTLNKNKWLYRPSSYPYLSGDTLRKFSHHIFDETNWNTNVKIKNDDVIFLNLEYLQSFLLEININNTDKSYKIIAHNNDNEINDLFIDNLEFSNIDLWIQNLNVAERKNLHLIPIGFENRRYVKNGKIQNLNKILNSNIEKKSIIISSFNSNTNIEERLPVEKLLNTIKYIDVLKFSSDEYLSSLSKYKFSICPPGNGLDTHRIWESLFTFTIPIVIKNNFSNNLLKNNIPCLVLNEWDELLDYDESTLEKLYEDYIKNYDFRIFTSFNYWWNRIN